MELFNTRGGQRKHILLKVSHLILERGQRKHILLGSSHLIPEGGRENVLLERSHLILEGGAEKTHLIMEQLFSSRGGQRKHILLGSSYFIQERGGIREIRIAHRKTTTCSMKLVNLIQILFL